MNSAFIATAGGALGIVLVVTAGPLYRWGAPLLTAFGTLALGALVGGVAVAAGLVAIGTALAKGRRPSIPVAAGILLGLLASGIPLQQVRAARGLPPIHDITTDIANPPTFDAVIRFRDARSNSLEIREDTLSAQRRAYPDVTTLTLAQPAGEVFDRAVEAAQDMDWQIVTADRGSGRIEATDTSRWFGFKDDVVVRLSPDGVATRVDVRSASRTGEGDRGANARRVRDYLDRLR